MATTFKYQATDPSGKKVTGTIKAASQGEVVADLRRKSLTPIEIRKAGGGLMAAWKQGKPKAAKKASVKKGELEVFTRQLSTMLSAGTTFSTNPLLAGAPPQ